jgi:hypothetical protein
MAFRQRSAQRGSRRCSEMEVEIGRGGGTEDDKAKARRKPGHEKFTVLNMSIANTEELSWGRLQVLEEKGSVTTQLGPDGWLRPAAPAAVSPRRVQVFLDSRRTNPLPHLG